MHDDLLTAATRTSWYVSRRVPLTHDETTRALGDLLRSSADADVLAGDVVVERVLHARPGEARGFLGRLRLGGALGTTRVEVEVEPWSRTDSTIAVRPRRRAPRQRAARYFDRAFLLLRQLEAHLLASAITSERVEMRRAS